MSIWKKLDKEETEEYRQWARSNYRVMGPINGTWHPVVQLECVRMNLENQQGRREDADHQNGTD